MAVRLLATFDVRVPEVVDYVGVTTRMWCPGIGLVVEGSISVPAQPAFRGLGVLSLDGVFRDRASEGADGLGWWVEKKRMVKVYDTAVEYVFDPYTFSKQGANPYGVLIEDIFQFQEYIRLPDRRVYYDGGPGGLQRMVGVVNGVTTPEGPVVGFYYGRIDPGRSETEVFISGGLPAQPPQGVFYDTVSHQLSSPYYHIGRPCDALIYAADWGVLVSIHDKDDATPRLYQKIRIWALEVHPTVISAVEVVDGTIKSGQVVTYRVRVLGADSDPAESELVNWSLAVGTAGALMDLQSPTDAQGYAYVQVQYDVGETGPSIIEASLEC